MPVLKCNGALADALRVYLPDTMEDAVRRCNLRILVPLVHEHDASFYGLAYVTPGTIGYAVLFVSVPSHVAHFYFQSLLFGVARLLGKESARGAASRILV